MPNSSGVALYYPTIEIPSDGWLLSTLLMWDHVERIVPRTVTPADTDVIEAIREAEVLESVEPQSGDQHRAEQRFESWLTRGTEDAGSLRSILQSSPQALSQLMAATRSQGTVLVHEDKMTGHAVSLLSGFLGEFHAAASRMGTKRDSANAATKATLEVNRQSDASGNWLRMPAWAGNLYMCGLARSMATRRGREPLTDRSPYLGWARFMGDKPLAPNQLVLDLQVPWPSASALTQHVVGTKSGRAKRLDQFLRFREKHSEERRLMRDTLLDMQEETRTLADAKALEECLDRWKKRVEKDGKEYRKAWRRDLAIAGLSGLSISVPATYLAGGQWLEQWSGEHFAGQAAAKVLAVGVGVAKAIDVFQQSRRASRAKNPWLYASIVDRRFA